METRTFFLWLLAISAVTAALLVLLHISVSQVKVHALFAVGSVALFILICIGLFFAGRSAARGRDKYAFNSLISISVFGKMVLALGFLFGYQKIVKPENKWFVGIFLLCYVVYTVFEVWFMSRLAKEER